MAQAHSGRGAGAGADGVVGGCVDAAPLHEPGCAGSRVPEEKRKFPACVDKLAADFSRFGKNVTNLGLRVMKLWKFLRVFGDSARKPENVS